MSREEQGFIYLGYYKYAKGLKRGGYSLYEGMYSDRAEDRTAGLTVVRANDAMALPLRFETLDDVKRYCNL